ncbi:MAG: hypothetical protein JRG74_05880 [Deltaproteobacteria bacterium]|nr:hypothetical protein [Deltaproteobacteria bacterium]
MWVSVKTGCQSDKALKFRILVPTLYMIVKDATALLARFFVISSIE